MKKCRFKNPLKCINGVKGAISLMLAVLMTPFLTVAGLLVEVGRYNSNMSVFDEAMNVSSVSTLAAYDAYLHKRWGLLAISQEVSIPEIYDSNLRVNTGVNNHHVEVHSLDVQGIRPLSHEEILYWQIMEYSKLNGTTKLTTEFLKLSDLLDYFEKMGDLDQILSIFSSGLETITAMWNLLKAVKNLYDSAEEIIDLFGEYEDEYEDFEDYGNDLIDCLVDKPDRNDYEDSEDYKADKEIWEEDYGLEDGYTLSDFKEDYRNMRDSYAGCLSDLATAISEYETANEKKDKAIQSLEKNVTTIAGTLIDLKQEHNEKKKDLEALEKDIKKAEEEEGYDENNPTHANRLDMYAALDAEITQQELEINMIEATTDAASKMKEKFTEAFDEYEAENGTVMGDFVNSLNTLRSKVKSLSVTEDSEPITFDEYCFELTPSGLKGFMYPDDIDAYLEEKLKNFFGNSLSALIEGFKTLSDNLFRTEMFYDSELAATIDVEYYDRLMSGLPGGDEASENNVLDILRDLGSLISSAASLTVKASLPLIGLLWAVEDLKSIVESFISLIENVKEFFNDIKQNVLTLASGRLLLCSYATYMVPCRTDFDSFQTITGGTPTLPEPPDESKLGAPGAINSLIKSLSQYLEDTGEDYTFTGAELEYVLCGSNSELGNQIYTFFALYLCRFILDIPAVVANGEVQTLATASTIAYPLVIGLFLFLEPFVEMILLVNGQEIPMYSTTIYLTPSGFPGLISRISSFCFTKEQEEDIQDAFVKAFQADNENYDYQSKLKEYEDREKEEANGGNSSGALKKGLVKFMTFNYREYCFMYMLLVVPEEQILARLANLIQMETLYHYQQSDPDFVFDLKKSYTFLQVDATVGMKQLLPSLAGFSFYTTTRTHYRGY